MTAYLLTAVLAVLAVTYVPWRGRRNVENLRAAVERDPRARVRFYLRFLGSVVPFVAIAVGVAASGEGLRSAGADWPPYATGRLLVVAPLGLAAYVLAALAVNRLLRVEVGDRAKVLLPANATERRLWPLVALGAGLSEEVLYRGLFVLHLHALDDRLPYAALVVGSALLFGAGHRYQGRFGVIGSTMLGLVFGTVAVATHSVYGAIGLHAAWDLLVGMVGARDLDP